jgi:hypothetical protein
MKRVVLFGMLFVLATTVSSPISRTPQK